jgi:microcystin-dependent protein
MYASVSPNAPPTDTLAAGVVNPSGGSQPHTNMQPYLGTNFSIALVGIFPSRG